jgi:hypothetical protein
LLFRLFSIESGGGECVISIDEMPLLKVRIDGKEGFVRDAEDFLALGIYPVGSGLQLSFT